MATLEQLVEKIRHRLGSSLSVSAVLGSDLAAGDLTIQLDSAQGFSQGIVELGLELVRVRQVDVATNTLTIPPFGRGYRGTEAAVHSAGSEVVFNPTWSKAVLADEVNGVLRQLYPDLYAVRVHETTFPTDRRDAIDVPETAVGIISVWSGDPVLDDVWLQEDVWSFNQDSTSDGKPLRVGGYWRAGDPVRIVYAERPGTFDLSDSDVTEADFETVTGLPERVTDLLALGVAARMAPFIEVSRLPNASAEARADAQAKPAGTAATTARLLAAEFRSRVQQEQRVLNKEHPIRVHRAR